MAGRARLPLILERSPESPFLRTRKGMLQTADFLALAAALAARLPDRRAAVNLCERRDHFLIAFAAMLTRNQTCLLPPSRVPAVVDEVMAEHPGCYKVDDTLVEAASAVRVEAPTVAPPIPADRVVVIGYTSGSTGRPKPNPKTWGGFAASTALNVSRLRDVLPALPEGRQPWIVATVPPQHMYGMELSVLMPLLGGVGIHAGHPLYPADIAAALADVPAPRILVSTPVHLRALLEAGVDLPEVAALVSATAPLPAELARAIEHRFGTVLLEYFGSTETCIIASRRTAIEEAWHPYQGVALQPVDDGTRVDAPWFDAPIVLQDVVEVLAGGTFAVRGRNADMVEVAGKRASLADLTRRLMAIPGVTDAVVFQPDDTDSATVRRLAALVVAQELTESQILAQLAPMVDPVFLPRPLLRVPRLPRNDVGKLPRGELLAALNR
jgi:acyl-coenzyme A synthetase/AMP-(fatty) acid ligase